MYAIIETGGKQYKVTEGQTIEVDRLDTAAGGTVELDSVLLIGDDTQVTTGTPVVDGAKVTATVQGHDRDRKVIVFKFKPKVRYRRKNGHRQHFTRLSIDKIITPGAEEDKPAPRTRRRKKEVTADGA